MSMLLCAHVREGHSERLLGIWSLEVSSLGWPLDLEEHVLQGGAL